MKPIDLRNECWADVIGRVEGSRLEVHAWLEMYGPCTCRELATQINRDLNSVAPRVTELYELGMVECIGKNGKRGIYKAVAPDVARLVFEERKAAIGVQRDLPFKEAI
jgi:hypothetical protein